MEKKEKAKLFTVWVGAVEVADYLLTKEQAEKLAALWVADGYDDVFVEGVK